MKLFNFIQYQEERRKIDSSERMCVLQQIEVIKQKNTCEYLIFLKYGGR